MSAHLDTLRRAHVPWGTLPVRLAHEHCGLGRVRTTHTLPPQPQARVCITAWLASSPQSRPHTTRQGCRIGAVHPHPGRGTTIASLRAMPPDPAALTVV
jgi:hypothetical protein